MYRNTATTLKVFAFNRNTAAPVTGDAANITCRFSVDGGARSAIADATPTELEDGFYLFDLTAAETNGATVDYFPESATPNVQVICVEHARHTRDTPQTIADAILIRNVSNVESIAPEHCLATIVLAMLEHTIVGTALTIRRTNGVTTHVVKTLTTNAGANPITGID